MNVSVWRAVVATSLGLNLWAAAPVVQAQAFPSKPIRIIVPFPPGGTSDILARVVGQKMGETIGQPVLVENRPGASGTIGSGIVAKAAPDGYTLISGSTTTTVVAAYLYRSLSFDPVKDFQPVARLASVPSVLIVHPSVPAKSLPELIALAKGQPGKINYSSGGAGTTQHLGGELFRYMAKVDIVHVAYKGGAPALNDLVGGQVAMSFEPLPTALSHIKGGKVRALGVTTPSRIGALPEVPSIAETLPGYEMSIWFGILGPAGMPREVTQRLNAEIVKALKTPEVRERLQGQGVDPIGDTVEEFAADMRKESARWGEFSKATGLKLD
jgi:tripartite-type tricarboxylate transporter receptor subunit TctC